MIIQAHRAGMSVEKITIVFEMDLIKVEEVVG